MLLEQVGLADIRADVMNLNVIRPYPVGPTDEINAWRQIVVHAESSPTAINLGETFIKGLAKAEEAARQVRQTGFMHSVINPGSLTMRLPEVSNSARICALTALSRFTRFSPIVHGGYVVNGDITRDKITNASIGDFVDPFDTDPDVESAYGIITAEERYMNHYLPESTPELDGPETWYKLAESTLMYAKVIKPAIATERTIGHLTGLTGNREDALALLALDRSVRIVPYLSLMQSAVDSCSRN